MDVPYSKRCDFVSITFLIMVISGKRFQRKRHCLICIFVNIVPARGFRFYHCCLHVQSDQCDDSGGTDGGGSVRGAAQYKRRRQNDGASEKCVRCAAAAGGPRAARRRLGAACMVPRQKGR